MKMTWGAKIGLSVVITTILFLILGVIFKTEAPLRDISLLLIASILIVQMISSTEL